MTREINLDEDWSTKLSEFIGSGKTYVGTRSKSDNNASSDIVDDNGNLCINKQNKTVLFLNQCRYPDTCMVISF